MVFFLFLSVILLIPNFHGGELAKLGSSLFVFSSSVLSILLCLLGICDAKSTSPVVKRLAGHHLQKLHELYVPFVLACYKDME